VTVPNVTNLLLSEASTSLRASRLRTGVVYNSTNEVRTDHLRVTHQDPDPGSQVNENSSVAMSVDALSPSPGVKDVFLFNCSRDKRAVAIWLFDSTSGSWKSESTLPAQYGSSGACPELGAMPTHLALESGHGYFVVAVDSQLNNCNSAMPDEASCQRWSWAGVGDDNGASFQATISLFGLWGGFRPREILTEH
jgi:PASTA domain